MQQDSLRAPARQRRMRLAMAALVALTLASAALYEFAFINPKFFDYALSLRTPRLLAICTAGFAIAAASLVFQTIIRNTIVTPCLLGMNALYVLVHTLVVFVFGSGSVLAVNACAAFAVDLAVMGAAAYFIYNMIFARTGGNVLYILLIGTVLSTFFSSAQTSLTRIMDPNEYDALLSVNAPLIAPALALLAVVAIWLRREIAILDILSLGREMAVNLGVDYERCVRRLMLGVALYIAIATALVGPLSFLGLITSNLARQMFRTHRHSWLIAGSVLTGVLILAAGQFLVEHAARYSVPVSVFITIGGGAYFLYLILTASRRQHA